MKLIDLLKLIAKGGDIPKRIEYKGMIFIFDDAFCVCRDYVLEKNKELSIFNWVSLNIFDLNNEIEILGDKE